MAAPNQPPGRLRLAVLAQSARVSGGHSVGKNLIASLGRAGPDIDFFFAIHSEGGLEGLCRGLAGENVLVCAGADMLGRWFWERFDLPMRLRQFRPQVILDLGSRGLRRPPCPQAVLCQRAHFFYPRDCWRGETLKYRLLFRLSAAHFRRALRRTDLLLCQTLVAQERVRSRYAFAGRTALCPNALSADVLSARPQAESPRTMKGLEDRFKLLCVSRWFPHKNLEAFAEVFEKYPAELAGVAAVVTVSDQDHPRARGFLRRIESPALKGRIVNVGPVVQEALAGYYSACQAMALPTLLESFSGTYLEAMHFGTPILTSDRDFARTVCGEAALYFDPLKPISLRDTILKLRKDPSLAPRLAAAGRERLASMPGWDEIAAGVLKELRGLAR